MVSRNHSKTKLHDSIHTRGPRVPPSVAHLRIALHRLCQSRTITSSTSSAVSRLHPQPQPRPLPDLFFPAMRTAASPRAGLWPPSRQVCDKETRAPGPPSNSEQASSGWAAVRGSGFFTLNHSLIVLCALKLSLPF